MLRKFKVLACLLLGLLAAAQAMAFSMVGELESWQTADLDYPGDYFQDFLGAGLRLGGTKNLGEEYRLSTPVITYAYDAAFLDYFGDAGVKAVDAAFAFMNSVPAVSTMSPDLSEFITEGNQRINQRAQALFLIDMKSAVIQMLVEHTGLGGETHIFDLSTRTCVTCDCTYGVIMRNFDPITWQPSQYVNGKFWTYQMEDECPANFASAVEVAVSTADSSGFTAVATPYTLRYGGFYLSLTRDDMGGLRYLYRKNNFNMEAPPAGASSTSGAVGSSPWSIPNFWGTNFTTTGTTGTGTTGTGTTTGTTAATNTAILTGGIEKVTYRKVHYDSLLGTNFIPITINYTVPVLVGYKVVNQSMSRTITAPDILITAADFAVDTVYASASVTATGNTGAITSTGASSPIGSGLVVFRTISFNSVVLNAGAGIGGGTTAVGLAGTIGGPGIINPQMEIIFNKMGPSYVNDNYFFFTQEQTDFTTPQLASFDGSTNDPIIFPSGASIRAMEAQNLIDPGQNQDIGGSQTFNPVISTVVTNGP